MYVTLSEAADYLECTEKQVRQLVFQKKIRAIYDGKDYLVNTAQFDTHLKQIEQYRAMMQEILNQPIPETLYVKDED
ncbi:excisionase family DNA-binding protein [Amphibacillus jilinensis]|uniref:excisionase family DNA-binding protein n=1 Tax=Amphibacillus jilinensis TaxID=1216008 RepID=UPI0002D9B31D|nr:excisionase family DNA-binding protein [Amphibacillus jilinensis]